MTQTTVRCLILACGNTLRSDDGIGPWLAQWAEDRFRDEPAVRVIARQQWTADLANDIARSESVLFIDCSIASTPGSVTIDAVHPATPDPGLTTHHTGAPELLAVARELYSSLPVPALLITIGAGSVELGEEFSEAVLDAIPQACALLETSIFRCLHERA